MNEILVPVDLTEEEKAVLAKLSKRQFMLIFPTIIIFTIFLLFGGIPFVSPWWIDAIVRAVIWLIAVGIASALAFIPLDRRDQYLSEYIYNKVIFWRSQKTYYP
jgi:hypothetical protein